MRGIRGALGALGAAALLASCDAVDEKSVSDAARDDIVGAAKVVHEVESGTSGATSLEVFHIVLDLGEENAAAAADEEAERLEEAGWTVSSGLPPARHDAYSKQANATASVFTLAEYLDGEHYDEHVRAELKEAVQSPVGLIVVVVEPRE